MNMVVGVMEAHGKLPLIEELQKAGGGVGGGDGVSAVCPLLSLSDPLGSKSGPPAG